MKLTLKNTQVTGLSETQGFLISPNHPVRIQAVPNSKVELFIDGVKQTGIELVNGKPAQLKKADKNLVLSLEGEPLVEITDFYATEGVSLDGAGWQFSNIDALGVQNGTVVSLAGDEITPQALPLAVLAGSGPGLGVLAVLGGLGLISASGGGTSLSPQEAALAKVEAYNNGNGQNTPIPTVQDYFDAGVTGVSSDNLAAVNAQVLKQSTGGADSAVKIQALTAAANAALAKIEAFNNGNGINPAPLNVADYEEAGITGVNANNLAAINAKILALSVGGADTGPEIQDAANAVMATIAAIAKVEAYNNGNGATPPALMADDYVAAGVTGVTVDNLAAVNAQVLKQGPGGADASAKIQSLVTLANAAITKIEAFNNGDGSLPSPLNLADFNEAGISGVTVDNLAALNVKILALSPGGADTAPEIQGVVNALSTAIAKVEAYNNGNGITPTALTLVDYTAAGISGVTVDNLAAVNVQVLKQTTGGADTPAEVQALVAAANAAIAKIEAYNNGDGSTPVALTPSDYAAAGIDGVTTDNVAAVNAQVFRQVTGGADTVPEVQALVATANSAIAKIEAYNNGDGTTPTALTPADYAAAGITGVTADNLAAVNVQVLKQVMGGADTAPEVQSLVALVNSAMDTIQVAAQNNSASDTTPSAATYAAAGVTGVTATNLAAINSALNSTAVAGAQADTTAEVQAIVSDYSAILASADGTAGNTATPLTAAQYTDVGVTGVSAGSTLNLLDNVVDGKASTAVDTVPELQALADAANHVMNIVASGTGTAPSVDDFVNLGITGVTALNLSILQDAIAHTTSANVDTVAELQAVINGGLSHPTFSTSLGGVSNLDVTSNLVLSVDQTVTIGHGNITITDLGGSNSGTGYHGDVNTNTQVIDVATAVANGLLTLSGTGANTKIIINPKWDLDLSSNYQVTIDDGAFMNAAGTQAAAHFSPVNFSTVTPGTHSSGGTVASEAVASQLMQDNGILAAGKSWMDIEGIGNNTGGMTQLGSLGGGSYALVMKNYATVPGGSTSSGGDTTDGIATHDTNVGFINFGNNDVLYFDSQVNDASKQRFDANYSIVLDGAKQGGLAGQNTLTEGLVPVPQQQGGQAYIALGLDGNTANSVYGAVYDLPGTPGFANAWHNQSPPVLMG